MNAKLQSGLAALLPIRFSLTKSREREQSRQPWSAWVQAALRLPLRAKPSSPRERIELLDRLSLGGKKSLLLISLGGERLLIGVGEQGAVSIRSLHGSLSRSPRAQESSARSLAGVRRAGRARRSR